MHYLISSGTRGVEEWIIAVVENRTSTEDRLVAREAPVNGRVDGGPLRGVSINPGKMKGLGAYVESADQLGERETVLAEHFQGLELPVIRPVLEFQSNLVIPCSILGQLESNSRRIVGCVGFYEQKGRRIANNSLTNSRYPGVGQSSIGDIEQTNERLIVDLRQGQLDLVVRKGHVSQRPENMGPESSDGNYNCQ